MDAGVPRLPSESHDTSRDELEVRSARLEYSTGHVAHISSTATGDITNSTARENKDPGNEKDVLALEYMRLLGGPTAWVRCDPAQSRGDQRH